MRTLQFWLPIIISRVAEGPQQLFIVNLYESLDVVVPNNTSGKNKQHLNYEKYSEVKRSTENDCDTSV